VEWHVHVVVKLYEVDISDFENIKSNNFKKGADTRLVALMERFFFFIEIKCD
jgi:hypothetical protein